MNLLQKLFGSRKPALNKPVVISRSYSEKELADMVDYCIQKIDIGLLSSKAEFHRIVAIKHHIRNWAEQNGL